MLGHCCWQTWQPGLVGSGRVKWPAGLHHPSPHHAAHHLGVAADARRSSTSQRTSPFSCAFALFASTPANMWNYTTARRPPIVWLVGSHPVTGQAGSFTLPGMKSSWPSGPVSFCASTLRSTLPSSRKVCRMSLFLFLMTYDVVLTVCLSVSLSVSVTVCVCLCVRTT